uniref:Methionine-rich repeat protein 1 n=1 Tax=Loligo forbesii TaxID=6618 RepID=Q8MPM4_LOLFO|nr:methionine-rich repeat protein 1 [Loligo forbesii]
MNRSMNRYQPSNMWGNMNRDRYSGMMEPMSRMSMDFQGRHMDSMDRMVDPGRWNDYDRYYGRSTFNYGWMENGDRFNRNLRPMDFPERYMDMSDYQMDMGGRWMDPYGRQCNPFNQCGYNRHGYYPGYSYGRNMCYPERWMDMSNYSMDMQGRYMDRRGRHCNPFSQHTNWYGRYRNYPGDNNYYNRNMYYPERHFDMSNWQMDMQGRWMDNQGRYNNPYWYGRNMYQPYQNNQWSGRWDYPGMDCGMDMQGGYMNNSNEGDYL